MICPTQECVLLQMNLRTDIHTEDSNDGSSFSCHTVGEKREKHVEKETGLLHV